MAKRHSCEAVVFTSRAHDNGTVKICMRLELSIRMVNAVNQGYFNAACREDSTWELCHSIHRSLETNMKFHSYISHSR